MHRVFVYGTLLAPEIYERVVGRVTRGAPAVLRAYQRRAIRQADFPAIVPQVGGVVNGMLYSQVDDYAMKVLDEYEGDWYSREIVQVQTGGRDNECLAFTYVLSPQHRHRLASADWDYDDFRRITLRRYLATL